MGCQGVPGNRLTSILLPRGVPDNLGAAPLLRIPATWYHCTKYMALRDAGLRSRPYRTGIADPQVPRTCGAGSATSGSEMRLAGLVLLRAGEVERRRM